MPVSLLISPLHRAAINGMLLQPTHATQDKHGNARIVLNPLLVAFAVSVPKFDEWGKLPFLLE